MSGRMGARRQIPAGPPLRWVEAVGQVRADAQRILDGRRPEPFAEQTLAGLVRRCAAADLPVEGESAREVKKAFVSLARAMTLSAGDRRAAIAAAVLAACGLLEALLDEQRRQAAAGWQRQFTD